MVGGFWPHHVWSCACSSGASVPANWRQTTPGANGLATARVIGIRESACSNCWLVNGTPGGWSNCKRMNWGPLHVSLTNLLIIAALSIGVAMWPVLLRIWICFLGCLGAKRLINWNSLWVSCRSAARAAKSTTSENWDFRICLASLRWCRLSWANLDAWYQQWKTFLAVAMRGRCSCLLWSHLLRMVPNAGFHVGSGRSTLPGGKCVQKVSRISWWRVWRVEFTFKVTSVSRVSSCCCALLTNSCQLGVQSKKACLLTWRCCMVTLWMCDVLSVGIQYRAMLQIMGVCPTKVWLRNGEFQRYLTALASESANISLTQMKSIRLAWSLWT